MVDVVGEKTPKTASSFNSHHQYKPLLMLLPKTEFQN
jgi:hypothetical protein